MGVDAEGVKPLMQTGSALPWPRQWPTHPTPLMVLSVVIPAGFALSVLVDLVARPGWRDPVDTFVSVAGVAYLAVVLGGSGTFLLRIRPGRRRKAIASDVIGAERGVRVPYSAFLYGWVVTLMAISFVGFAALLPGMLIEPKLTDHALALPAAVVGLVAIPFCGWFLIDIVRGRIERGYILLTPQGVHHRSALLEEYLPWESIVRVSAANQQGPMIILDVAANGVRRRFTSRVTLHRSPSAGPAKISCRALAADPALAYHALVFYRTHPAARAELAGDAGIKRIRRGDLVVK